MEVRPRLAAWFLLGCLPLSALTRDQLLLIVNESSAASCGIAEYYARARGLPYSQICRIRVTENEEIPREVYEEQIAAPVREYLTRRGWRDRILCLVTTTGAPLKIRGGYGLRGDAASVDSELATLHMEMAGEPVPREGPLPNPYFGKRTPFERASYGMYLVTRLTGFTVADVHAMIGRAARARNAGIVAIDQRGPEADQGNLWLRQAAQALPPHRVRLEETKAVLSGLRNVIGYASWGSNDPNHRRRDLGMEWLPGAIATQFVSTDGRTFREPPPSWRITNWNDRANHWAGSPQSLTGDLIRQGASGASGHVYEPFLQFTPRPRVLFTAYLMDGLTLAESYWTAIPAISWMNVVVGDPLCRVGPAR